MKFKVRFEYCECGCHGHEAEGPIKLWIFNDLDDNFTLHRGHGRFAPVVARANDWKTIQEKANDIVNKLITAAYTD